MLRIGVLGAGHLGKIHIKCLKELENFELVGFYDIDTERAKAVEAEFGIRRFESRDELIDSVDAVDIVTPTIAHYESAALALPWCRMPNSVACSSPA